MDNYHILEDIGHGRYSCVYKGREKGAIEFVALKSIQKDKMRDRGKYQLRNAFIYIASCIDIHYTV